MSSAPAPVIIEEPASAMLVEGGFVFWATNQACPGGEFPGVCAVNYKYVDGSLTTGWNDWRSPPAEPAREIASGNLAADADHLYWFDRGGAVQQLRQRVIGSDTTVLATRADPATLGEVAVDAQFVYWTENLGDAGAGRIYRAPKGGGPRQLMVENPARPIRRLQADGSGGVLYVTSIPAGLCCGDLLQRAAPAPGGGFSVDSADFQAVDAFTHDSAGVYFITRQGRGGRTNVRRAPLADLGDDVLLADLGDDDTLRYPAMATRGALLYWQEQLGALGPIYRMPVAGGAPALFTGNLLEAHEMTVGDTALFVRAAASIHRFPLDGAGPPRLDIDADDQPPEVVQVIQDSNQLVPLVARKRTFVRVYARLAESEESELRLLPAAVLHGSRDGAPLPDSPILPVDRRPLHAAAAVDRSDQMTTLLFELPRSWTEGTVRLRAVANPSRAVVEVDYDNNEASRTVTFHERRGICLDMLPVLTHAGVSESGWNPQILSHFERATSLLPTPAVFGSWRGGYPRRIPIVDDHYNMRDIDHKNMLMMNLSVEFGWQGSPAQCGDAFMIRTVTVPDSDRLGMSWGLLPYIYTLRSFDSEDPRNAPYGGTDGMAHEIGHQMEIGHVLCPVSGSGAPAWPYATLRYESQCRIADSNDPIGFDVMSRQLIVPLDAAGDPLASDVMSYGPAPNWTSDQIYDHMYEKLAPEAGAPASAKALAGDVAAAPLVAGFVAADGEVFLGRAYRASGAPLAATRERLAAAAQPSADYELRAYDAAGTLRGAWPLNVAASSDEGDGPTLGFLNVLDDDDEVSRIEVVGVAGTLAVRDGGAVAPAVTVHQPRAGDVIASTMTVRWESFDADGDELVHIVRYSSDGGASWHVLAADLAGGALEVDMSGMPGGDQAFVEVVASDGVRSGAASVGPFIVPPRAPRAHILTEAFDELDGTTGATSRQSAPIALRGYAYDAEDGELSGAALAWRAEGPVVHAAQGTVFRAPRLPPGHYALSLVGTDAGGGAGGAQTTLVVLPKHIGGAAAPVVDGRCADAGYAADDDPMFLAHGDGALAQARAVRSGADLYVCLDGLPDRDGVDRATVAVDPDGDGGTHPESGDLLFSVDDQAVQRVLRGDGGGGTVADDAAQGLRAAVAFTDGRWSAELRLDGAVVGPLAALVRIRVAHEREGDAGGGAAWPAGSPAETPGSWGLASFGDGPPVLTVPDDIVVPADGPDGAVVTWQVTVVDAEDPSPTVACAPASGTRFPVGTTTVTCTARDAAGNQAAAGFAVTVEPTERSRKQAVRNAVAAMVPGGDLDTTARLALAVLMLDVSLQPGLWASGDRLHWAAGLLVFDGEKAAVDALRAIRTPSAGVLAAIAELVAIDAALAETAIDDAEGAIIDHAGGNATLLAAARLELERARASLQEAQAESARGRPAQAILRYRDAWRRAQFAIVYARLA